MATDLSERTPTKTITRAIDVHVPEWTREDLDAALDRYEATLQDRLNPSVRLKDSFRARVFAAYGLEEDTSYAPDDRKMEILYDDSRRYVCPDTLRIIKDLEARDLNADLDRALDHTGKVTRGLDNYLTFYQGEAYGIETEIRSARNDDMFLAYDGPIKTAWVTDVTDPDDDLLERLANGAFDRKKRERLKQKCPLPLE